MMVCFMIVSILAAAGSRNTAYAVTDYDLEEYAAKMDSFTENEGYRDYLEALEEAERPEVTIEIDAADYVRVSDMEPEEYTDYEGMSGISILTGEEGLIEYEVTIEQAGLYELGLEYYPTEGKSAAIQRGIFIDGELPFQEFSSLEFQRIWKNETEEWEVDNQGNDIKPGQVEAPEWTVGWCYDSEGYVTDRLAVYLSEGTHTITLVSVREPMMLRRLILTNNRQPEAYEEVLRETSEAGAQDSSGYLQVVEAEHATKKSSQMLYPVQDQSSPAIAPYSAKELKNNTIGGNSWRLVGQWLEWEFEVPEDGYYNLGVHVKQNFVKGIYVSRKIMIDGEVPFEEMNDYGFSYEQNWRQELLSDEDGNPYRFYLTAGTHTIRMEVVLGEFSEIISDVEEILSELNRIYRRVIRIIGVEPAQYRDYQIERSLPGLADDTAAASAALTAVIDRLIEVAGSGSDRETVLVTMRDQLDLLTEDVEMFSNVIGSYKTNMSAVGTWITQVLEQPLQLDALYITSPDTGLPEVNDSFFSYLVHELKTLFYSFIIDYNQIGNISDEEETETITVWVGTGRDQANVIKSLIDEDFTKNTGIGVNVMLVDMSTLLQATLAGQGPDVAIQLSTNASLNQAGNDLPMNYGVRNALYDLSEFEDLDEVRTRFYESAMEPYEFEGKTYALPETQTFMMMFYRKDILQELNLEVPETWDDMKIALSVLSKNQMEIGMLATEQVFATLLYQNGGRYYNEDGTASALDETVAMNVFKEYCEYYSKYRLDRETSVEQRFRTGETPIILADYTTYNNLQVSAPDIKGLWGFTTVPGTQKEDGTIDKTTVSSGSAAVIMQACENPEAAWEFLKWWTSADIQTAYGREMESLMGASARYPTANIEAFENLPWPRSDYETLKEQFEWVVAIPQVPGGYYTWRNVNNAFYQVVTNNQSPRETLTDYVRYINAEITNKREELGLSTYQANQEDDGT